MYLMNITKEIDMSKAPLIVYQVMFDEKYVGPSLIENECYADRDTAKAKAKEMTEGMCTGERFYVQPLTVK